LGSILFSDTVYICKKNIIKLLWNFVMDGFVTRTCGLDGGLEPTVGKSHWS